MEIKEIKTEDNCLEIIFEDRYITFGLQDINSIEQLIEQLQSAKDRLNEMK